MEIDVVNATSGRGVLSHLFKEYGPYAGEVLTRITGTIIATEAGTTTGYALEMVQERGKLFVSPGEEVYEGMIVGEESPQRGHFLQCGPGQGAHQLPLAGLRRGHWPDAPATKLLVARARDRIHRLRDEFVEVTPKNLRLRKRVLKATERRKIEAEGLEDEKALTVRSRAGVPGGGERRLVVIDQQRLLHARHRHRIRGAGSPRLEEHLSRARL